MVLGNSLHKEYSHLNVGDEVMYGKYAGTEFKQDEHEFLIVEYNDILAILEN